MKLKENDFFKPSAIYLSERHYNKLEELKDHMVMSNNLHVSNSVFFRTMIEFLSENKDCCENLKQYITKNRGKSYINKFNTLVSENKDIEEISEALGVHKDLIEKIFNKNK